MAHGFLSFAPSKVSTKADLQLSRLLRGTKERDLCGRYFAVDFCAFTSSSTKKLTVLGATFKTNYTTPLSDSKINACYRLVTNAYLFS